MTYQTTYKKIFFATSISILIIILIVLFVSNHKPKPPKKIPMSDLTNAIHPTSLVISLTRDDQDQLHLSEIQASTYTPNDYSPTYPDHYYKFEMYQQNGTLLTDGEFMNETTLISDPLPGKPPINPQNIILYKFKLFLPYIPGTSKILIKDEFGNIKLTIPLKPLP